MDSGKNSGVERPVTGFQISDFRFKLRLACEAGESVKPGASAPRTSKQNVRARETGDSGVRAFARCRGLATEIDFILGLAPRLYAVACFAG